MDARRDFNDRQRFDYFLLVTGSDMRPSISLFSPDSREPLRSLPLPNLIGTSPALIGSNEQSVEYSKKILKVSFFFKIRLIKLRCFFLHAGHLGLK